MGEVQVYERLEARITKGDVDALLARWEFGKKLNEEHLRRDGVSMYGLVDELSNALEISTAEIYNRAQFAREYDTEAEVRAALKEYGSWYAICSRGMGARAARDPNR